MPSRGSLCGDRGLLQAAAQRLPAVAAAANAAANTAAVSAATAAAAVAAGAAGADQIRRGPTARTLFTES